MTDDVPLAADLEAKKCRDIIEYELVLVRDPTALPKESFERRHALKDRLLFEKVDIFLRVIGGRLGMHHQGQLQIGKSIFKFIPRYVADVKTLTHVI
jgi:hypothetical protein